MSDKFDFLKNNKEKTTGKKRNIRELSPVVFPFSDDEDSDDVVLKIPKKAEKMVETTRNILKKMQKCKVLIPKDKNGRRYYRIHEDKRTNNVNKMGNRKNPIVRIKKTIIAKTSPKSGKTYSSEKAKVEQSSKKSTPKRVLMRFKLSTPISNKKKRTYPKTPVKKSNFSRGCHMKNSTPALIREFGKRFFLAYVPIHKDNLVQFVSKSKFGRSPPSKKKKLNTSSVRFNETVEYFGDTDSEKEEDDDDEFSSEPLPVSLVPAVNGSFGTSTPETKPKGKKGNSERKKPILTPAAKKNYKLSDEKAVVNLTNDEEEDDDAEYIGKYSYSTLLFISTNQFKFLLKILLFFFF